MKDRMQNRPTSERTAAKRRQLLKGLATGGGITAVMKGLPEHWTQPVVDSVLLPAHAQLSALTLSCETASGPVGASAAPGPDIGIIPPAIVNPIAVVTPAPGGSAMVLVEVFRDNVMVAPFPINQDVSSGTSAPLGLSAGSVGQLEVRYTFAGMTCSLFWNCVNIP